MQNNLLMVAILALFIEIYLRQNTGVGLMERIANVVTVCKLVLLVLAIKATMWLLDKLVSYVKDDSLN